MSTEYESYFVIGYQGVAVLKEVVNILGGDSECYSDYLGELSESLFDVAGDIVLKICKEHVVVDPEDIQITYDDDNDVFGITIQKFSVKPLKMPLLVSTLENVLLDLIPDLPYDKLKAFTMTGSF